MLLFRLGFRLHTEKDSSAVLYNITHVQKHRTHTATVLFKFFHDAHNYDPRVPKLKETVASM